MANVKVLFCGKTDGAKTIIIFQIYRCGRIKKRQRTFFRMVGEYGPREFEKEKKK